MVGQTEDGCESISIHVEYIGVSSSEWGLQASFFLFLIISTLDK